MKGIWHEKCPVAPEKLFGKAKIESIIVSENTFVLV